MPASVASRRVLYIPGFDPMPPRRYRELYRREASAQAAISGHRIVQSRGRDALSWEVRAKIDGHETRSEISVLPWSDIVSASMRPGIAETYAGLMRTAWVYVASGALWRLTRLRRGPVIAALYPIVVLVLQAAVALGLGAALFGLVGGLPGAGLGLAAVPLVLGAFRAADGKVFAWYLMHDYAYSSSLGGAYPPELSSRIDSFAREIARALAGDHDEVLIVGHSSGAILAVSALARAMRTGRVPANGPRLSLLTLGHVIPMVSFLPGANTLRADLHLMAEQEDIVWVDVTAPGDACSFALCDPVAVSGVAPEAQRWPLVLSAAFSRTLAPQTRRRLRWRYFRLHLQYLCAFDRPEGYDYFAITAGPLSLAERFSGRRHSQSRIVRAASKYRDTAA